MQEDHLEVKEGGRKVQEGRPNRQEDATGGIPGADAARGPDAWTKKTREREKEGLDSEGAAAGRRRTHAASAMARDGK